MLAGLVQVLDGRAGGAAAMGPGERHLLFGPLVGIALGGMDLQSRLQMGDRLLDCFRAVAAVGELKLDRREIGMQRSPLVNHRRAIRGFERS